MTLETTGCRPVAIKLLQCSSHLCMFLADFARFPGLLVISAPCKTAQMPPFLCFPVRSQQIEIPLESLFSGQKEHMNSFNINFWPPPKTPHLGPPEISLRASFPGKDRKKGPI